MTYAALNTECLNQQLYRVLSLNLDGPALTVVKNLAEEAKTRGINAWVETTKDHLGATGQRMASLVARVFNPKRAGKYADAMQFIAGWESAVRQFERGAKTTLIDYLKICGLMQVVPGELEKDMNRQTSTLSTYDKFKKYAMDQVALRKEPRAKPWKSQKERKRASIHCDTPPGLLCPLWHAQAEDLRKTTVPCERLPQ